MLKTRKISASGVRKNKLNSTRKVYFSYTIDSFFFLILVLRKTINSRFSLKDLLNISLNQSENSAYCVCKSLHICGLSESERLSEREKEKHLASVSPEEQLSPDNKNRAQHFNKGPTSGTP